MGHVHEEAILVQGDQGGRILTENSIEWEGFGKKRKRASRLGVSREKDEGVGKG